MTGALDNQRISLIGLGNMGRPMARNLAAASARMVVQNRGRGPVDELAAEGMATADTPAAAAEASDTIIVMVSDTPAVSRVITGPHGVIEGLTPGKLVIDMGTTAVTATRRMAAKIEAAGCDWLDAPVSGGDLGAREASLTIMAGGTQAAMARARPILDVLGSRVTHIGEAGAGQVAKAANQIIVGLTIGAVAEALFLAKSAGVDMAKVREALKGGFADSRILEVHGQRMVDGFFEPGGRVAIQHKDLHQGLDLAGDLGVTLPAVEHATKLWDIMLKKGWGELDHSALYKLIEGS